MKKTIIALTALTLTLTAFTTSTMVTEKKKRASSSEQMAERVVAALQQSSAKDYAALFPSLSDFKEMMKESSEIYGNYLKEAQREFATNYESKLMPAVKESFEAILSEGKSKGIDWNNIRYVGIEVENEPQQRFSPIPVNIIVSSNGIEHKLHIERALVVNGQWKVSQFLKLI